MYIHTNLYIYICVYTYIYIYYEYYTYTSHVVRKVAPKTPECGDDSPIARSSGMGSSNHLKLKLPNRPAFPSI